MAHKAEKKPARKETRRVETNGGEEGREGTGGEKAPSGEETPQGSRIRRDARLCSV